MKEKNTPGLSHKKIMKTNYRGRTPDGSANPVDVHVGMRIRARRKLLGLSQETLAKMLGLTYQQVQKYERGLNRIGCSRLFDIAQVMDTTIEYFFADMDKTIASQSPRWLRLNPLKLETEMAVEYLPPADPLQETKMIELVYAYKKITSPERAKLVYDLTIEMSKYPVKMENED